jgi:hypothetical protein
MAAGTRGAALFQGNHHFARLVGTCGDLYAVERVSSYASLFPEVLPSMVWQRRAHIALSFLSMVDSLEHSPAGPLHHCDVQEGNFGITPDNTVKMIDADLVYPADRMRDILAQPACAADADCEFFDCGSKCNVSSGRCLAVNLHNNLQVEDGSHSNRLCANTSFQPRNGDGNN